MAVRHDTPSAAKVVRVIEVRALRGAGVDESDPVREVTQYWSFNGLLLAERDKKTPDTMTISFSGLLGPLTKKEEIL